MKDYIIWLKSGECISGIARDSNIEELQKIFSDTMNTNSKVLFKDEEGVVAIDLSRVEAIAINIQQEKSKIGF